jgi:hypothetical protein
MNKQEPPQFVLRRFLFLQTIHGKALLTNRLSATPFSKRKLYQIL